MVVFEQKAEIRPRFGASHSNSPTVNLKRGPPIERFLVQTLGELGVGGQALALR